MGRLIDEYKRKKAMVGKPTIMYWIASTKEGVTLVEREIKIVNDLGDKTEFIFYSEHDETNYEDRIYPYEIVLKTNDPNDVWEKDSYSSKESYWWSGTNYATLNKEIAERILKDETKRVYWKYQDPNRIEEPLPTAPIG